MKDYIRTHKLNRPDVNLGIKRHDLINGLKKADHWDTTFSSKARKPVARMGRPKKPPARKPTARKLVARMGRPKKPPARKNNNNKNALTAQELDDATNLLANFSSVS
jgi:hypothetical protein